MILSDAYSPRPTRRGLLATGLGAAVLGPGLLAAQDPPQPRSAADRRDQPWKLPDGEDPAALSTAENRFWTEILRDHADFFTMLMPGDALKKRRGEAQDFRETFDKRLRKLGDGLLKKDDYVDFNKESLEHAKRFVDWKLGMRVEQASGRLRSLVWPSFFQAAAHEGEAFCKRLERLNKGEPSLVRQEVAELWLGDASDHAAMVAHLLDPNEKRLHHDAMEASKKFLEIKAAAETDPTKVPAAAQERHQMEAEIQKAVAEGRVHSIIHPLMADHMVREGLRFIEELKRVG
jgi:hypothetical protein